MRGKIALCADEASLSEPLLLGLDEASLEGIPWLVAHASGASLRRATASSAKIDEVWIASSDDISPINLVAALRKDGFSKSVLLVMEKESGSALSRASSAGATEVLSPDELASRFAVERARRARMDEVSVSHDLMKRTLSVPKKAPGKILNGNPRNAALAHRAPAHVNRASIGAGLLLVVMGSSGGSGKTAVAAVAASALAAQGKRVALMDGDLQFGCISGAFGVKSPTTFEDIANAPDKLESLAKDARPGMVSIVGAPAKLERSEALSACVSKAALDATNLFDAVVVDTSTSWSDMHALLMESASCTLFVVDQTASSIRSCRHAMDLCKRMGVATGSFAFALNKCSRRSALSGADVSCALGGVPVHELADGGPEVEEMCSLGMAEALSQSGNAFAKSVAALMADVVPGVDGAAAASNTRPPESERSLFKSFGRRRSQRKRGRRQEPMVVQRGEPKRDCQLLDGIFWEERL
ncbi:MAG: hypothetical protein HFJ65_02245 [Eggerthellaceae bacterium]|nr:hypothetical protein [Eggerthellaceae bacterium]